MGILGKTHIFLAMGVCWSTARYIPIWQKCVPIIYQQHRMHIVLQDLQGLMDGDVCSWFQAQLHLKDLAFDVQTWCTSLNMQFVRHNMCFFMHLHLRDYIYWCWTLRKQQQQWQQPVCLILSLKTRCNFTTHCSEHNNQCWLKWQQRYFYIACQAGCFQSSNSNHDHSTHVRHKCKHSTC